MPKPVIAAVAVACTLLALDVIWLTLMVDRLYGAHLPGMLLGGFRLVPAMLFYLLYIAGIVYFAVMPALARDSIRLAAINGALLGLLCYGTYDLTNHATLKVWSTIVTVADMVWGTLLTATAASAGAWATRRARALDLKRA